MPALGLLLFAALSSGCGESDSAEVVAAPGVAFEGSIEPKLVGEWSTASKLSSMSLKEDGTATMVNVAPGRGTSKTDGEWRLSGDHLLFRVGTASGAPVSRYSARLSGDTLRLTQKSTKLDIEYQRSK